MKKITLLFTLTLLITVNFTAQNTVTIDGTKTWNGYINAFNISDNNFAFGFSYGIADMKTTIATSLVTLQPNFKIWTDENSNPAWFDNSTTPNKYIEGNSYVEDSALTGSDLTFTGNIDSNNMDGAYTVVAFIKALDPNNGFATVVNNTIAIGSSGTFTVSATAMELASGLVVQYGFAVTGPLSDPANESSVGKIELSPAVLKTNNFEVSNISSYPNPARNTLNISADNTIENVTIYNVLGKKVKSVTINKNADNIDVSSLNTGVYILKYIVNNAVGTMKFVKE